MKKVLIILIAALMCLNGYTQNRRPTPKQKFIYMTSLGYATGLGQIVLEQQTVQNRNFNISVNQLLGYQFNPYFQLGIGAGFDFWRHTAFIPLYLNITVNMTDTKFVPVFYTNMGYSFKWYLSSIPEKMTRVVHGTKSGPMGEAGLGLRVNINEKLSFLLAACYKVQYTDIRYTILAPGDPDFSAYSTNKSKNVLYHYAGVRVGIQY